VAFGSGRSVPRKFSFVHNHYSLDPGHSTWRWSYLFIIPRTLVRTWRTRFYLGVSTCGIPLLLCKNGAPGTLLLFRLSGIYDLFLGKANSWMRGGCWS
jgi:hypothetical protein